MQVTSSRFTTTQPRVLSALGLTTTQPRVLSALGLTTTQPRVLSALGLLTASIRRNVHTCSPALQTTRCRRWQCPASAAYRGEYAPQQAPPEPMRQQNMPQYTPQSSPQSQPRQAIMLPPRQRRPAVRRFSPPPDYEPTLSCQQVVDKQVVTRTTGKSLGIISHMYADPDTLAVVSANLRPKGLSLSVPSNENLLLETFCQIGDVVLVHDESALDFVAQDEALGFVDLIGCPVYTSNGTSLGRVREYTFSPESGRVDLIKYDALGWPAIPERLIGVWQVGVESVRAMEGDSIYLLPRCEDQILRVSDGPMEVALLAFQKLFQAAGPDDTAEVGSVDADYQRWKDSYGRQFYEFYGMSPPATRQELENFYQGYEAARQVPAEPKSLPPGRQTPVMEVLRPASRDRMPQREAVRVRRPAPREDPRTRRRVAQPEAQRQPQSAAPGRGQPGTVASVPIYDPRPLPAYRQRDADGRYGERLQDPPAAQPSGQAFDEWVESQPQQREPLFQGAGDDYGRNEAYGAASSAQYAPRLQSQPSRSQYEAGQGPSWQQSGSADRPWQGGADASASPRGVQTPNRQDNRRMNGSDQPQRPVNQPAAAGASEQEPLRAVQQGRAPPNRNGSQSQQREPLQTGGRSEDPLRNAPERRSAWSDDLVEQRPAVQARDQAQPGAVDNPKGRLAVAQLQQSELDPPTAEQRERDAMWHSGNDSNSGNGTSTQLGSIASRQEQMSGDRR